MANREFGFCTSKSGFVPQTGRVRTSNMRVGTIYVYIFWSISIFFGTLHCKRMKI
jgi:hypothetical protein